jgi:hypothetical protein
MILLCKTVDAFPFSRRKIGRISYQSNADLNGLDWRGVRIIAQINSRRCINIWIINAFSKYARTMMESKTQKYTWKQAVPRDSGQHELPICALLQYVRSLVVKDESEAGVCINMSLSTASTFCYYSQTRQEDQIEGHTKIHIDFNFKNCDARNLEKACSFVLSKIQDAGIVKAKLVAPYPEVHRMQGKEITINLRQQSISRRDLQQFITK